MVEATALIFTLVAEILSNEIRLTTKPVSEETLLYTWNHLLDSRMIQAKNREAVERHMVHEFQEGSLDVCKIEVEIKVLVVYVCHDGDSG